MSSFVLAVTLVASVLGVGAAAVVEAGPAGAVTGSFDATCRTTGGPGAPVVTHRTIDYEVHAPESMPPGITVYVQTDFKNTGAEIARAHGVGTIIDDD